MPEVEISVGGRTFDVACQEGEEAFLQAAAAMLDSEASVLVEQTGRIPETRMLLMSGLMLADRTAGVEDKVKGLEDEIAALKAELTALKSAPPPEPQRVEVPVVPNSVTDTLAELAAQAEALADRVEERGTAS
ncbi:cell division protein ZapA [Pseudooceanicola sediminis]|uniref:Cell division protein ZapA n=1 Tax=Pseudooceanicola sediminis TaxID=2211117 RepID=A0A399J547_9RHOB|nr:cell division protein ZapA [Pseudooceanicola sediminis]KAA2317354.1 cell division protein ZapA [Puniceibacterium sp. HSS470]RII39707.1 cell division protein ZapA [Pseudooceanicola sediminis]|tara:strand:- start:36381 stop:36779 length:399 start_codon:yes stop_codon:yes gene_type:complete